MRRPRSLLLISLTIGTAGLLLWVIRSEAERFEHVRVLNFPEVQAVDGKVEVLRPIPHSRLERRENTVLTPSPRADPSEWVVEGTIETDGFTHVVLSLTGDLRGRPGEPGRIGAILVPDVDGPRRILREEELAVLSLEVTAPVESGRSWFASESVRLPVAFPSYRVYFWNDSTVSATADLYVYLTH